MWSHKPEQPSSASYGTIRIQAGSTLSVAGARALALVADDSVEIAGTLDVSANGPTSGPGVSLQSGSIPDATLASPKGGGGAGFQSAGAAGGTTSTSGGAANGGAAMADPATLTVLVGGPRSGPAGSNGGGGGGAATLISCHGSVDISGTIDAGGGGGGGGVANALFRFPGFGGGAGGYVVLQAPAVTVTGSLYANGGGGGAGLMANDTTGMSGEDAARVEAPASGGTAQNGEGAGGDGAWRDRPSMVGNRSTVNMALPGGGGGGFGFFQIYVPAGVTPSVMPAHASPAFQPSGTITVR